MQFSTKIHSVSVFSRVPLQLPIPRSRPSRLRTCSVTSRRTSSVNFSTATTTAMLPRSLYSVAQLPRSPPIPPATLVESIKAEGGLTFHVPTPIPDASLWLENLAGPHLSWLRALPTSTIARGSSYVDNPIRRLLAPRTGQKFFIHLEGSTPIIIEVFGSIRSHGHQEGDSR